MRPIFQVSAELTQPTLLLSFENSWTFPLKEEPNIKVEPKEEIVISDDDSDDEICVVDPRLNQKLLTAAQNGNICELKKLISSGTLFK